MKILVTGGAGFIGTNLCKKLVGLGHQVISLDNYFTGSKQNHISGVDYREGHTKDIEKYITEKVDIIYHLGEYSRVERSFFEPEIVWDLNVVGTIAVLEFWRKTKCKLLYAGSSTKFANDTSGKNMSPYAWAKASNTELVKNYSEWFSLPFAITYFYNVYGPGERSGLYGTVIEIFRQQYLSKKPLTVVSPGTQKRNFTHVDDIVDGLVLVAERGKGDEFGLGSEENHSVLEIAKMYNCLIEMLPERQGNRFSSRLNISKSKKLGWTAKRKIEDYIKEITS